jgi:hypothetical protein
MRKRRRAESQRRQHVAAKGWDPASHPAWLTEEAYRQKVQPLLRGITTSRVATALTAYASEIKKGRKLPHPRHWVNLAELVGSQV